MNSVFENSFSGHAYVFEGVRLMRSDIQAAADLIVESYRNGGKLLLAGNGGSAADAQHIAGELVGRFLKERRALPAIALNTNSTIITAIGNDYSFETVFARQVSAFGQPGDVLISITTSGTSPNVLRASEVARDLGMKVIGLSGASGGTLKALCDLCLCVPSSETPRVQEMHILIAHIICELTELALAD